MGFRSNVVVGECRSNVVIGEGRFGGRILLKSRDSAVLMCLSRRETRFVILSSVLFLYVLCSERKYGTREQETLKSGEQWSGLTLFPILYLALGQVSEALGERLQGSANRFLELNTTLWYLGS